MASRSLGTLTVDLVAKIGGFTGGLDKSDRATAKFCKQTEDNLKQAGKAYLTYGAVAGTALAALTVQSVNAANEVSRLSQVSGTSANEFQRYAAGASLVGIEQEKFADILKDTNDKLGDFFQTGAGPMVDFFEQIAPKVGVTADQFRKLSGPQALELYVSSLEKANVSQNEMTFYLEAIASDATALLPLLRNNAEGFRILGENAAVFDDDTIQNANRMKAALFLIEQQGASLKNELVSQVLPSLVSLSGVLVEGSADGRQAAADFSFVGTALGEIASVGVGAVTAVQLAGKAIGGTTAALVALVTDGVGASRAVFAEMLADLDATAQGAANLQREVLAAAEGNGSAGADRVAELASLFTQIDQTAGQAKASIGNMGDTAEDASKRAAAEAKKQADALKELMKPVLAYQALVRELRTDEEKLSDQLRERFAIIEEGTIGGDPDTQRRAISAAFGDAPGFGGLDATVGGAASELLRINEAEDQLNEWYATQLSMLEQFRAERSDLNELWNEQEAALTQEHQDRLAGIEQARQLAALAAAETMFGNLADVTRQFAGEQSAAYKVLFAIEKAAAIARSIIAIQTAIAQASASGPFPANLAAMASVASATAGLISTISSTQLQGQAHDGMDYVPKTGTYLLEKGERVTTAETSKKMDGMIDEARAGGMGGLNIHNHFDTDEVVGGYMSSPGAERSVMNIVSRNAATMRQILQ